MDESRVKVITRIEVTETGSQSKHVFHVDGEYSDPEVRREIDAKLAATPFGKPRELYKGVKVVVSTYREGVHHAMHR